MSSINGENEIILDYVLENEKNLELALRIHQTYDDIRKSILLKFFNGLEKILRSRLPSEWDVVNEFEKHAYDRYKGLSITKKNWKDYYHIELSPDKYNARDFYIGIYKEKSLPLIGQGKLVRILDSSIIPGGGSDPEYEWWYSPDLPYREFDDIELLVKAQFTDEVELYFFDKFMRIRELSESLIDDALSGSNQQ